MDSFWPAFLANFISDFIVGVVLVSFFQWLKVRTEKIELEIVASLIELSPGNMLNFYLKNTGKVPFAEKEIYWHVYFEQDYFNLGKSIENEHNPLHLYEHHMIGDKPYANFNSLLHAPIFPGRSLPLFSIRAASTLNEPMKNAIDQHPLVYAISTKRGMFPNPPGILTKLAGIWKQGRPLPKGHGRIPIVSGGSWELNVM